MSTMFDLHSSSSSPITATSSGLFSHRKRGEYFAFL